MIIIITEGERETLLWALHVALKERNEENNLMKTGVYMQLEGLINKIKK